MLGDGVGTVTRDIAYNDVALAAIRHIDVVISRRAGPILLGEAKIDTGHGINFSLINSEKYLKEITRT